MDLSWINEMIVLRSVVDKHLKLIDRRLFETIDLSCQFDSPFLIK